MLQRYPWPGNVRELRNVIERLMIMVPGDTITARRPGVSRPRRRVGRRADAAQPSRLPLHEARERFERDYILQALALQHGNISRTAEVLGVERSNLYRKMRAFGIAPAARREESLRRDAVTRTQTKDASVVGPGFSLGDPQRRRFSSTWSPLNPSICK